MLNFSGLVEPCDLHHEIPEHHFGRPVTLTSPLQSHWHSRYVQEFFHPPKLRLYLTFLVISRAP